MKTLKIITVIASAMLLNAAIYAQKTHAQTAQDKLQVKVLDVGNGLCCVIKMPGDKYAIYDAGTAKDKGKSAWKGITGFIPKGTEIEFLVLSHYDDEHIGAADSIVWIYKPKKIFRTGYGIQNPKKDSTKAMKNFGKALWSYKGKDHNLNKESTTMKPGLEHAFGEVKVNFLCGFGNPLPEWNISEKNTEELRNSTSIVMRIEYKGKSILFCGDAVGWNEGFPEDSVYATEAWLLGNAPAALLQPDVLIASGGGSLNGSSYPFVENTKPKYVVFSTGKGSAATPRYAVIDRFTYYLTETKNMFRTDRGDGFNEYVNPNTKPKEWDKFSYEKCVDTTGDDDVRINITASGAVQVAYINPRDACK